MSGERDLGRLLAAMAPRLHEGEWVYVAVDAAPDEAVATVLEDEGLCAIVPRAVADARGWPYAFVAAWITLTVHSALDAVGLTAEVARRLTAAGIPCNAVAGLHHDHLFVPADRATDALAALSAGR